MADDKDGLLEGTENVQQPETVNSDAENITVAVALRDRIQTVKDKVKEIPEILKARLETGGNVYVSFGVVVLAIVFSLMLVTWMEIVYPEQSSQKTVLIVLLTFIVIGLISVIFLYRLCREEQNAVIHEEKITFLIVKLLFLVVFGFFYMGHIVLYFLKHLTSNHCPDANLGMIYNVFALLYTLGLLIFFIFCHHRHGKNTFAQNVWSLGVLLANVCIWLDTFFSEFKLFPAMDLSKGTDFSKTKHNRNCTYNSNISSVIDDSAAFVEPAVTEFALLAIDFLFFKCQLSQLAPSRESTGATSESSESELRTENPRTRGRRSVIVVFLQLICCGSCLGFVSFSMVIEIYDKVPKKDKETAELPIEYGIYTIFQTSLKIVMMFLVLPLMLSFWNRFNYRFNVWAFVLIISCFGNVLYQMLHMFALVKYKDKKFDSVSNTYFIVSWLNNIISIILAWGQTLFILGTHEQLKFRRNFSFWEEKIYRQSPIIFFFLGVLNLGLWMGDSIGEVRVPVLNLIPYTSFDPEFWDVMTGIIFPLTIFFRFHTGLDFLKMWWEGCNMQNISNNVTTNEIQIV